MQVHYACTARVVLVIHQFAHSLQNEETLLWSIYKVLSTQWLLLPSTSVTL